MSRTGSTIMLSVLFLLMLCLAAPATADTISGTTGSATTFYVVSDGNASVTLEMSMGIACITHQNAITRTEKTSDEYGAWVISCNGCSYGWYNDYQLIDTLHNISGCVSSTNDKTMKLSFSASGVYMVTVTPCTASQMNKIWAVDTFQYWMNPASWCCTQTKNCKVVWERPSTQVNIVCMDQSGNVLKSQTQMMYNSDYVSAPSISGYTVSGSSQQYVTVGSGTREQTVTFAYRSNRPTSVSVTVRYEDEYSNRIKSSETVTLSSSGYVYAPTINGYTLTSSSSSYVTVSGGSASPSTVTFRYKKKSDSDSKASSADQILSRSKRSSRATYQRYQEGTQSLSNSSFSNLQDGSSYSSWYHTIWKSERTDNVADLTMYFSGSSIRWIWIRGGDSSSSYYDNARPKQVEVKVYGDRTVSTSIYMTDSYYAGVDGYQCIDLGSTVTGVTRVEFYFRDYYQGSVNKYKMAVRDIIMN